MLVPGKLSRSPTRSSPPLWRWSPTVQKLRQTKSMASWCWFDHARSHNHKQNCLDVSALKRSGVCTQQVENVLVAPAAVRPANESSSATKRRRSNDAWQNMHNLVHHWINVHKAHPSFAFGESPFSEILYYLFKWCIFDLVEVSYIWRPCFNNNFFTRSSDVRFPSCTIAC